MYTRDEVVSGRKCGLKKFDEAVSRVSISTLIEQGIENAKRFQSSHPSPLLDEKDPWNTFSWGFSQAWRNACKKHYGGPSTANLDEMLTPEQLEQVAKILNITKPYAIEWQRKGSPWNRHRDINGGWVPNE